MSSNGFMPNCCVVGALRRSTARYLANVVARNLDTKTRCIELSTLQRCAGHLTSRTDITEAYQVGGAAAKAAFEGVFCRNPCESSQN